MEQPQEETNCLMERIENLETDLNIQKNLLQDDKKQHNNSGGKNRFSFIYLFYLFFFL